MKNLYLIPFRDFRETPDISYELLKKAAEDRGIKVNPIAMEDFDFSQKYKLNQDDGLYRISTRTQSALIEKFLINDNVTTLYENWLFCFGKLNSLVGSSLFHQKHNLPIIKTIFCLTANRDLLKKYVDYLDGLPVVIKAIGGSGGIGVMKIDSFESLCSIADYFGTIDSNFILRKFIEYKEHARLIVLGDKVIAAVKDNKVKDDFRSNFGDDLHGTPKNFGETINKVAVDAVRILGYEFGGVDILIDEDNNPHIAEVNCPCYFPRAQKVTGVDIAAAMVDYLIKKSNG